VRFGITLPQIGEHATKENVINLSKKAERQGFDSLWVLERLVSPLKPMNPYPGTKDGSLPTHKLLTFVAANTEKISIGIAVIDMFYQSLHVNLSACSAIPNKSWLTHSFSSITC